MSGLKHGLSAGRRRVRSLRVGLLVCGLLVGLVVPVAGLAASRMWVGFQDDPSFRWDPQRGFLLQRAHQLSASIVRTTVYWSKVAPTRPASASDPFDPAYQFNDLDDFVRRAAAQGMAVMLTVWGTPAWANGGQGQNYSPSKLSDLQAFATALASRYSGRFAGYPFVSMYTIWNEPNLGQFLSPQYDSQRKALAPFLYARLYRAAYTGLKAGNPRALVAIGETSARGRDSYLGQAGTQETESPGRFAQLLATVRPRLPFDAYSEHPYPTDLRQPPFATVRWPNVTLSQLPRFERSLDQWFGRRNIPLWITEYGYQTTPPKPKGVSYSQQATYLRQVLTTLRRDPRVQVFVWFVMHDQPAAGSWQSGLIPAEAGEKPAANVFSALAQQLDARNPTLTIKAGLSNPIVRLPVYELETYDPPASLLGSTVKAYDSQGKLVGILQPTGTLALDGTVSLPAPLTTSKTGATYTITFDIGDANGNHLTRTATLTST